MKALCKGTRKGLPLSLSSCLLRFWASCGWRRHCLSSCSAVLTLHCCLHACTWMCAKSRAAWDGYPCEDQQAGHVSYPRTGKPSQQECGRVGWGGVTEEPENKPCFGKPLVFKNKDSSKNLSWVWGHSCSVVLDNALYRMGTCCTDILGTLPRHRSGKVRQVSYRDHDARGRPAAEVVIQEPLKCCILLDN